MMQSLTMSVILFITLILVHKTSAVIYQLNASEYDQMPPIYHMDDYKSCLQDPDGIYCYADIELVSSEPSSLFDMIFEYSKHSTTHFNHTKLHYGICLTSSCKRQYENKENLVDSSKILETCLKKTFKEDYKLEINLSDEPYCRGSIEKININFEDIVVAVICGTILILNIVGSFYDVRHETKDPRGSNFLVCFSMRRNWRRLMAPTANGPDPRMKRLIGLNGLKAMTTIFTVAGHSLMPFMISAANPRYFEEIYHNIFYHIMFNGTIIIQLFIMMSGFWLVYNIQVYSEKHQLTWKLVPRGIIMRWLRLTPAYALILAITCTWMRFFGRGPLWKKVVQAEVETCRSEWWLNMLYLNNYIDHSQCMVQSWYLAADMQLSIIGIVVCVMIKSSLGKSICLTLLFVAGLVLPAAHTVFQDLDGILIASPEAARTFFVMDRTFNYVYKRGHTNLTCYVLGLLLGYLVYYRQNINFDIKKSTGYRFLVWLVVPVGLGLIMMCSIFYADGPRASLTTRALSAMILKPTYGILMAVLIIGIVFKAEDTYRSILEWTFWGIPARLSYSVFLLHIMIIRSYSGSNGSLLHVSFWNIMLGYACMVFITFIMAIPFYILVESPFAQVIKLYISVEADKKTKQLHQE